MFHCHVAADIYGRKTNVTLRLDKTPSYDELVNYVESHFDVAGRANRPDGYVDVKFKVHTLKIYDSILTRWVDLYSAAQLCRGCQLYAFQPENTWHSDLQGFIPKGRPVVAWRSQKQPARRDRSAAANDSDLPPSKASKLRAVFGYLDSGSKGYIVLAELTAYMKKLDIHIPPGQMPSVLTRPGSSNLSFEEWTTFCHNHPSLLDALFFRSCPSWNRNTATLTAHEELLALRRYRERTLEEIKERRALWQQRTAVEKTLDAQRKETELAKLQAEIATTNEQAALDKLFFSNAVQYTASGNGGERWTG